jgi:uncharacterized phiE125 gp8 family phage protein
MPSVLVTPPALEPVSLAEAKAHLRVSHSDEDQIIGALVASARRIVEARSGLMLISQTWVHSLDRWPDYGVIEIPLAPVLAVEELAVYGEDDTKAVIDAAHYFADLASRPPRLLLRGSRMWPPPGRTLNGISVTVEAGFGATAAAVPEPLRQAMLILVAHWYENRGNAEPPAMPLTVDALIRPYREVRL